MNGVQIKMISLPKEEWDNVVHTLSVLDEKMTKLISNGRKEFLTKKEVMNILKIGRTTLDRYIDEELLHKVKLGKGTRGYIKQSEIDELMG